jgi:chemotaxis protein CheX
MSDHSSLAIRDRRKEWLPILELAVQEVFEIMVGSRLTAAATPSRSDLPIELTAMVGLSGALRGILTFGCGASPANQIAARMAGEDTILSEGQVWDAVGEICNMIAGNFKNKLTLLDGRCLLGVPAVVSGPAVRFHSMTGGDSLELILNFCDAPIIVRLDLHD